jgi:hypothetical protein
LQLFPAVVLMFREARRRVTLASLYCRFQGHRRPRPIGDCTGWTARKGRTSTGVAKKLDDGAWRKHAKQGRQASGLPPAKLDEKPNSKRKTDVIKHVILPVGAVGHTVGALPTLPRFPRGRGSPQVLERCRSEPGAPQERVERKKKVIKWTTVCNQHCEARKKAQAANMCSRQREL